MINLIPPHGHTALKHEYVLRVATLYGVILGGILIAAAALMVPTYVLTSSQLKAVRYDNPDMEEIEAAFGRASTEIEIANAVMSQLRTGEDDQTYSAFLEEIVRSASGGISFSTFQIVPTEGKVVNILVQGSAANRNALASFKETLEKSAFFEKAEIPISDLVRDTNLPFIVTITLAESTQQP